MRDVRDEAAQQLELAHSEAKEKLSETKKQLASAEEKLVSKGSNKKQHATHDSNNKSPKSSHAHSSGSVLGDVDLDEGPDALPVQEQIKNALRASSARVLDLFREWDENGDGEISRDEFRKAVASLGLTVPKKEVDILFDQWDSDGGGAIAYKEMTRILKKTRGHMLVEGVGGGKPPPSFKGAASTAVATSGAGTKSA